SVMRTGNDRRDFIKQGLFLAGAAGVLTSALAPIAARAQAVSKPVRRPDRYEDSFIFERKPYTWPGNKTLAVWIAPNVEVWNYDSPGGGGCFSEHRQHRAGRHQLRMERVWPESRPVAFRRRVRRGRRQVTVALNSLVCEHYPKAVDEMKKRGWE